MPRTFSPPPRVSGPNMHQDRWLVVSFEVGGGFPAFPVHAQPAILRIWQEAHSTVSIVPIDDDSPQICTWFCCVLLWGGVVLVVYMALFLKEASQTLRKSTQPLKHTTKHNKARNVYIALATYRTHMNKSRAGKVYVQCAGAGTNISFGALLRIGVCRESGAILMLYIIR